MTESLIVEGIHWITRAIEVTGTAIIVVGAGSSLIRFLQQSLKGPTNMSSATSGRASVKPFFSDSNSWLRPTSSTLSRSSQRLAVSRSLPALC